MEPANVIAGHARLPSEPSNEKCYVRFVNKSARSVDVIWIDFTARFVKYTLLEHGQFIDVNTYKHHSWVAVDSRTRDALLLNGVYRYEPQPVHEYILDRVRGFRFPHKVRVVVCITLPMYSLYLRTLMVVRDLVKTEEDVEKLDLAWFVKEQLKRVVKRRIESSVLLPPDNTDI